MNRFEQLVKQDAYIDKTPLIEAFINNTNTALLIRPPHFGLHTLMDTIEAYFQGRKDLFARCLIDYKQRETYPILRFKFQVGKYHQPGGLRTYLMQTLKAFSDQYGFEMKNDQSPIIVFRDLLRKLHKQSGKLIVVLMDHYDAPLLQTRNTPFYGETLRLLTSFMLVLKDHDDDLKISVVTGTTHQPDCLREVNNLTNFSNKIRFHELCGFTKAECPSADEDLYGGYRFAPGGKLLIHPGLLKGESLEMPAFLKELIKSSDFDINALKPLSLWRLPSDSLFSWLLDYGFLTLLQQSNDDYLYGIPNKSAERTLSALLKR
ncbi:MAG: AAA family ATPase [Intestinibaculum porci]|uniref:AAA family ATPase n=1 Tax=Intestinibaculum porci TaxID=2487118 RepID=UPI003EFBB047